MPRSSATRKVTANQHNPRHENGLAPPGRRIVKQKSNGNLDASVIGKTHAPATLLTPPPRSQSMTLEHACGSYTNGTLVEAKNTHGSKGGIAGDARRLSEESSDMSEEYPNGRYNIDEQSHKSIDISASKNAALRDTGIVHTALSVLRSCPHGDTIGILLILLQIPPAFLTIVHFLFAALTFVPPAGVSVTSIPSINDLFQSSGGTPSMATIVIADICFLTVWLFLWLPAQEFALDLAQAVISISLGGGFAGKTCGSKSVALCFALVSGSHIMHRKDLRQSGPSLKWSSLPGSTPASAIESFSTMPSLSDLHDPTRITTGWIRSMLAVHVLTQGIIRVVRRWLSRREVGQPNLKTRKIDPEAGAITQSQPQSNTSVELSATATSISATPISSVPIGQGLASPVIANVKAKEKLLSGKRKRRQGTYVRGQQPLWAALASTKVVVVKEYEQSQVAGEAGSNIADINNLESAPFDFEEGRVWIARVGASDVHFNTSYFDEGEQEEEDSAYESGTSTDDTSASADGTSPLYVRVNGARWISIRIRKSISTEPELLTPDIQWAGAIYGLTPSSTYWCEFVRSEDGIVMYSASVTTQPAPTADLTIHPPSSTMQKSLRPSSPTTTLNTSIAAFNIKSTESRVRLKRTRKDHRSSAAALKKEVDTFKSRVTTSGSSDDRQRQRILQSTQHIRQAEDNAAVIAAEFEAMGPVPGEVVLEWREQKEAWNVEREGQAASREAISGLKLGANRSISSTQADLTTISQKRERLQARHTKLTEQHERITSTTAQDMDEKQRRAADITTQEAMEQQYLNEVNASDSRHQDYTFRTQHSWHLAEQLANAYSQQQQAQQQQLGAAPASPEGDIPGTMPTYISHPSARRHQGFVFPFPAFGAPSSSYTRSSGSRARSSSILSTGSGFSDFSDVEPTASAAISMARNLPEEGFERLRREGSEGGSRSGSGSQGSPASPMTS
ncbi:MAG: hypothetical protein M1835_003118 [Candelina submexicana]|nr:MAG: hypothetical protein M1835_003118 [Candelina submexicana]